jgi:hypothetical protein
MYLKMQELGETLWNILWRIILFVSAFLLWVTLVGSCILLVWRGFDLTGMNVFLHSSYPEFSPFRMYIYSVAALGSILSFILCILAIIFLVGKDLCFKAGILISDNWQLACRIVKMRKEYPN